ncbi:MAG: o-succinylbenzoate--CoA ligase [Pseudonocardiaceae bacterium]
MHQVWLDGGAESVRALSAALADALGGGEAVLPLDSRYPGAAGLRDAMCPDDPVEPGAAVLVTTSGTTGTPKGVLLSADALRASAAATHSRIGGPGTWLLATPAQYIGGLQVLVRSLVAGTTPGVLDLAGGFRPDAFAEAAAPVLRADGPRYTALVPTQLTRLLDAGGAGLAAVRDFDAVIIGGAAISSELRARASGSGLRVIGAYGMSETASGCIYDGVPLDGVRVHLTSADGRQAGQLMIAGDVLALGYRGDPETTREVFRGGWFHTSDIGRIGEDGRIEVLGRTDDVINTGGVKVPAGIVESALLEHSGVAEACVVSLPNAEWGEIVAAAIIPADPDHPPAQAELTLLVRRRAGPAAVPKLIRPFAKFPSRGPGKVDRAALRADLERHVGER